MADIALETPSLKVVLEDGRALTVQATNPDYIRWDRTAAKHGWPTLRQAPFMWMTFLAWSALRRTGQIADAVTWEEFSDRMCLQVTSAGATELTNGKAPADDLLAGLLEDAVPAEVGPTSEGAEPG